MFFIKHNSLQSDIFFNPIFIPCFSGLRFFRVQVFRGPIFSGSRFFRIQVSECPGFCGSRFFRVLVFLGPGFSGYNFSGSRFFRVWVKDLPAGFRGSRFLWVQVFPGPSFFGSMSFRVLLPGSGPGFRGSRFSSIMDTFSVKTKRKVYYTSEVPSFINDKQIVVSIRLLNSLLEIITGEKLCKLC